MELRAEGVDFLLCTEGEIAFFIWAWLWIRKLASRGPQIGLVIEEEEIYTNCHARMAVTWEPAFWNDVRKMDQIHLPVDVMFADFIHTLVSTTEGENQKSAPRECLDAARKQWERIKKIEAQTPDELVRVFALTEDGKCNALMNAMIECALNVAKKQQAKFCNPESLNWMDDVRGAISCLESLKKLYSEQPIIPIVNRVEHRKELEQSLKRIAIFALLKSSNLEERSEVSRLGHCDSLQSVVAELKLDGYRALGRLHEIARFPVIHYYCLQLLYEKPLEHLIIPVWKSYKYAETVYASGSESLPEEVITPDVVLALLSLAPLQYPDTSQKMQVAPEEIGMNSESPSVTPLPLMSRMERFLRIQTFMKTMAMPLIDVGFYGSLVSAEQEASGRDNAFHSIPDAFASAIDALQEHANECSTFSVPSGLYIAAMESMVFAGRRSSDIKKWTILMPQAVNILERYGLCQSLIEYLVAKEGIVPVMGKRRLRRDGYPLSKLPIFVITGEKGIAVEALEDGSHQILIAILVVLLKEAFEHSVRAVRDTSRMPIVNVSIDSDRGTITITNDCKDFNIKKFESGQQNRILQLFIARVAGWSLDKLQPPGPEMQVVRVLRRNEVS